MAFFDVKNLTQEQVELSQRIDEAYLQLSQLIDELSCTEGIDVPYVHHAKIRLLVSRRDLLMSIPWGIKV
jgi:hypothetical protein